MSQSDRDSTITKQVKLGFQCQFDVVILFIVFLLHDDTLTFERFPKGYSEVT